MLLSQDDLLPQFCILKIDLVERRDLILILTIINLFLTPALSFGVSVDLLLQATGSLDYTSQPLCFFFVDENPLLMKLSFTTSKVSILSSKISPVFMK